MRVLVLTPFLHDTAPGLRFRIEQWARRLEGDGCEFTFVPFEDERLHDILYSPGRFATKTFLMLIACLRRAGVLGRLREFDVVYLPREAAMLGPAVIERCLSLLGKPFVYDFDDPIWMHYSSPANRFLSRLKCPAKTKSICGMATRVIVGNRLLAEWAGRHAAHVDVVPSTIDLDCYSPRSHARAEAPVTLGWTGSHSTLPFLLSIRGVLKRLAATHRFRLLVVSHTDVFKLPDVPVEVVSRRWSAATESEDVQQMHIGLGPFPDSGWTPWRCHGKVLQYMAAGLPAVVSRLGVLPDYIEDGVHGFTASTDDEWYAKLGRLIEDAELRRQMGAAARQRIEQQYSAQVWAPRVRDILEAAALTAGPRRRGGRVPQTRPEMEVRR